MAVAKLETPDANHMSNLSYLREEKSRRYLDLLRGVFTPCHEIELTMDATRYSGLDTEIAVIYSPEVDICGYAPPMVSRPGFECYDGVFNVVVFRFSVRVDMFDFCPRVATAGAYFPKAVVKRDQISPKHGSKRGPGTNFTQAGAER